MKTKKLINIGLYQMGEKALADADYYQRGPKTGRENPWNSTWTGKNGINSKQDFLNNREVQDIAIREYHEKLWSYLRSNSSDKYICQNINRQEVTKSGLIGAAHLVDHGKILEYLKSGGKIIAKDQSGVTCQEYMQNLGGKNYSKETFDPKPLYF